MANINTTTDLNDAASPEQIIGILRRAAIGAYEGAGECESAWQDSGAGKPWVMIAKELERCADRIEKNL